MWGHRVGWIPRECGGRVSLMMYLLISHDRFGSTSDPSLNGHLRYPNDIDRSLNETVTDMISVESRSALNQNDSWVS